MVNIAVSDTYYLFFVVHLVLIGFYVLYCGVCRCFTFLAFPWHRAHRRRPDCGSRRDASTPHSTGRLTEVVVVLPVRRKRRQTADVLLPDNRGHRRSYGADDGRAGVVFVRSTHFDRGAGRCAHCVRSQTVGVTLQPSGDRRSRRSATDV